jgi:hypothetical protein
MSELLGFLVFFLFLLFVYFFFYQLRYRPPTAAVWL